MRRWLATALGLGVSVGTLFLLLLQRYVAEVDDGVRSRGTEEKLRRRRSRERAEREFERR